MTVLQPGTRAWRIAPCGTTEVFLSRLLPNGAAVVFSRGQKSVWAKRPMTIAAGDLFASEALARSEYRKRRTVALLADPLANLNLTLPVPA